MEKHAPSVKALFDRALELGTPVERTAYLDEACAGAPDLRRQVETLLRAHGEAASFLEASPLVHSETIDIERCMPPVAEGPGSRIGPYKLLQKIGEGGMGAVYMAEQEEPVRRRVALKIIKPGMDSAQVIARFEAERQALALMNHQNIARVHDAGATLTGRPYFVMELVHGVPITHYCDENRLTPGQRLALFIPVCQAVQHAHQKGVIHRDLKPTNILVTLYDGHLRRDRLLAGLGESLLRQGKDAEAEPPLRECLERRKERVPAARCRFEAMSLLGRSLAGQGKLAEAEPLLVEGLEGMERLENEVSAEDPDADDRSLALAEAAEWLAGLGERKNAR